MMPRPTAAEQFDPSRHAGNASVSASERPPAFDVGYSVHYCIGPLLARLQLQEAVTRTAIRYMEMRLEPGVIVPESCPSWSSRPDYASGTAEIERLMPPAIGTTSHS